jgi:sodium-dependent dicarboxylate transporter 2/3/5
MSFGLPLSVVMLIITWFYLTRFVFHSEVDHLPGGQELIQRQIKQLGPMSREEKYVTVVFCTVALLWILRGLFKPVGLEMVKDSTIAIAGALVLFMIPVNLSRREFLLDWKTAVTIPWDIIILFGGGFALAQGFSESGLTLWLAEQLSVLQGVDVLLIIAVVVLLVIFLTEVTSNTATASLLLPVMGALAVAIDVHPMGLMVAAVIAASFAFMLPVATPPNAIVFSSRYVTIPQMVRAGIWLNLTGVLLITGFVYFVLPLVWGIRDIWKEICSRKACVSRAPAAMFMRILQSSSSSSPAAPKICQPAKLATPSVRVPASDEVATILMTSSPFSQS